MEHSINATRSLRSPASFRPRVADQLLPAAEIQPRLLPLLRGNGEAPQFRWHGFRWRERDVVAESSRGALAWFDIAPPEDAIAPLRALFPGASFRHDAPGVLRCLRATASACAAGLPFELRVCGTPFQQDVWATLARIPAGQVLGYGMLASAMGRSGAARAVGSAAAANRIAVFIPCHRLVPAAGGPGSYRWGAALKRELLVAERAGAHVGSRMAA